MTDKLREAALAVLESTKSLFLCCSDFSHLPQDLHPDGKCIPWGRYNDALTALEAALAEPAIKESLTVAEPEPEPVCEKDPYLCGFVQCQLGKVCKWAEAKLREKNT